MCMYVAERLSGQQKVEHVTVEVQDYSLFSTELTDGSNFCC